MGTSLAGAEMLSIFCKGKSGKYSAQNHRLQSPEWKCLEKMKTETSPSHSRYNIKVIAPDYRYMETTCKLLGKEKGKGGYKQQKR